MIKILSELKKPFILTIVLMLICGLFYPLLITGISQIIFPYQANGSIIEVNGKAIGSELVGQDFKDNRFMQGRPSAVGYNTYEGELKGVASGSSNYAPSNPALTQRVQEDMESFLAAHPDVTADEIPADLMTASGSGLDPDISPASAAVQIPQLAINNGLSEAELEKIIEKRTEQKFLGIFGESRVNVLLVNLDIAIAIGLI